MTRLADIAQDRSGDKGNVLNVAVLIHDRWNYEHVKRQITAERVKSELSPLVCGTVNRYELDHLRLLNFVMTDSLEGGVNASLNLDGHGKSFSYLFLAMELDLSGKPNTGTTFDD